MKTRYITRSYKKSWDHWFDTCREAFNLSVAIANEDANDLVTLERRIWDEDGRIISSKIVRVFANKKWITI